MDNIGGDCKNMITEQDLKQFLIDDGFELTDEEFNKLLSRVKVEVNQKLDFPITATSFTQTQKSFNGSVLVVDMFPLQSIHSLKIGEYCLHEDKDYQINFDDGIIYFNRTWNGFLRLEYIAGLTDNDYNTYITPLILQLLEYHLDKTPNKDASSIKEGEITITYDNTTLTSNRINTMIQELNNRYTTFLRMI